jgi:ferric-dicitrate binding protein FerR (iron transport regulator)
MPESNSPPPRSDAEILLDLMARADAADDRPIGRGAELTPDDRARLELRAVLRATEPPGIAWDVDQSWDRLSARMESPGRPKLVDGRRFPGSGIRPWVGPALIAAGVSALAVTGWYQTARRDVVVLPPETPAVVAPIERSATRGQRIYFRLPDGTGVTLGPASTLRYAADYGKTTREVELEGVGYFRVVHQPNRPFAVRLGPTVVRDLGTRFMVRARSGERRVEVAVAEGNVAIDRQRQARSVVLGVGDVARVADSIGLRVAHGVDLSRYLAWTVGELVFDRRPLKEVTDELGRWYDVEIKLSPSLEGRRVTAAYSDAPVTEVLTLLAASLDLQLSGGGHQFVLSSR